MAGGAHRLDALAAQAVQQRSHEVGQRTRRARKATARFPATNSRTCSHRAHNCSPGKQNPGAKMGRYPPTSDETTCLTAGVGPVGMMLGLLAVGCAGKSHGDGKRADKSAHGVVYSLGSCCSRRAHPRSVVSPGRSTDDGSPESSVRPDGTWRRQRRAHSVPAAAQTSSRRAARAPNRRQQRRRRHHRSTTRRSDPARTAHPHRGSTRTNRPPPPRSGRPDGPDGPARPARAPGDRTRTEQAGGRVRWSLVGRRRRCGIASVPGKRRSWWTSCAICSCC